MTKKNQEDLRQYLAPNSNEEIEEDIQYDDYLNRPDSFDVSYYTNQYQYEDPNVINQTTASQDSKNLPGQSRPNNFSGQLRGISKKNLNRDSETASQMSDSNFSLRSSLVRTPNSGIDYEAFGTLRSTQFDEGRYASFAPSSDSLIALLENKKNQRPHNNSAYSRTNSWISGNGTPSYIDYNNATEAFLLNELQFPAWSDPNQVPISKDEIEHIFKTLKDKFGFQEDNMKNMFDSLMTQLDSRASRMSPNQALLSLHSDYIGGQHANYKLWYFSAQLNRNVETSKKSSSNQKENEEQIPLDIDLENQNLPGILEENWRNQMNQLTAHEKIQHLALWLLLWGEAANVRFTPECLCFIFKCALDYLTSPEGQNENTPLGEGDFLNTVITPLYKFLRDQGYEIINGKFFKRERDHADTIGYDDVNELFWSPDGLNRIVLEDKSKLMDYPPSERFFKLSQVNWKKAFYKTYKERRTTLHLAVNFSRIWILHFCVFYYYTIWNAPFLFEQGDNTKDSTSKKAKPYFHNHPFREDPNYPEDKAFQMSLTSLAGALAAFISLFGTLVELFFIPSFWKNYKILLRRSSILFLLFILNIIPFGYVYISAKGSLLDPKKTGSQDGIRRIIAVVHLLFSIATTVALTIIPPSRLFLRKSRHQTQDSLTNLTFTSNYPTLSPKSRSISFALWACVFACKFVESYFFLALSFKDPFNAVYVLQIPKCRDPILGSLLCQYQGKITVAIMILLDLILFFLDTYLWYIIWSTTFSVARSFYLGISIWTPWRNIFERLPKRIYAKILATADMEIKYKPKVLCSQIWNAIVISMFREHLLSVDHVQKLLYQQVPSDEEGKRSLKPPTFFVSQEDTSFKTEFFPVGSEAERRISFFAQSLSTSLPEPLPVENMPTFTVLTPHYSEKILLTLREIIRESDQHTRVTLLEYLKALHPIEWDNFVKDTKVLAEEFNISQMTNSGGLYNVEDKKDERLAKTEDMAFYSIGFKSAAPEFTLRTRIWASLRTQTLYRTISGFFNYSKAIKLLYRVENPELVQLFGGSGSEKLEKELEKMARRKFNFVVSMQRFTKFNKDEKECVDFLLKTYPDLKIAYLEESPSQLEGEEPRIYSVLIDGHSEILPDGSRKPIYRVQLPGNPIIGDGKSDNQNHAVIFYRGEYIQLIDANQDNYLEEAMKIRSILGEFEQYDVPEVSPYSPAAEDQPHPVAILGAREYIFSENIGVLGDVAAGKEQTFGTLTARIMAAIGGKLHYGHPDILNAIFMTTRGGISKAQKGLHLNEDIYAGMNAFNRGGRIKHIEYYQCGKGRDLGFGSVLAFFTKIGSGMGEQMLSREQYWMGTQLPIDRFLTFYYAHPGFHINNIFIMFSIQLFMLMVICLGALAFNFGPDKEGQDSMLCASTEDPFSPLEPTGCFNLVPVIEWVQRTVLSIFVVLIIAYLPLFLQVLTEQGFIRTLTRLGKQFLSFSPLFEVFVTQIYTTSLLSNLSFGGARYIATGRGFATTRLPFAILYSRFAGPSMYFGMRLMFMLLYASLIIWTPHFIYFWITITSLCVAPFIFNPHQFSLTDFLVDYKDFLRWLSAGNSKSDSNSWISHCRSSRIRITGYKRKKLGESNQKGVAHIPRASKSVIMFSEIFMPLVYAILGITIFSFLGTVSFDGKFPKTSNLLVIAALSFAPVLINAVVLLVLFGISIFLGPIFSVCMPSFGTLIAGIGHGFSVILFIGEFILLWYTQKWVLASAVLGLMTIQLVQRAFFTILMSLFLTREFGHDETNMAWWTGKWFGRGLGFSALSQPLREWLCKIIESSLFAADCLMGHLILFFLAPFCIIPYIDKWHSMMLFWLSPSRQIRSPIYSLKQRSERRRITIVYGTIFFFLYFLFIAILVVPQVLPFLRNIKIGIPLLT